MKKALALVLALVLALSMAVSAFAAVSGLVILGDTTAPAKDGRLDLSKEANQITFTDNGAYSEKLYVATYVGGTYYMLITDNGLKNVAVSASGCVDAKVVAYDPATMKGAEATYSIVDKDDNVYDMSTLLGTLSETQTAKLAKVAAQYGNNDATVYPYVKAVVEAANTNAKYEKFFVEASQDYYVVILTVEPNYSVATKMGSFKVTADQLNADGKTYTAVASDVFYVYADVTIFEYEEVKWAAANKGKLVVGENGYSALLDANYTKDEYNVEALRNRDNASVVSTTAFRAIAGKDLTVVANDVMEVTLKAVAEGQKGVNFVAYGLEYLNAAGKDITLTSTLDKQLATIEFGFLGDQVVKGEYEITVDLGCDWYKLRQAFGLQLEEEDIITYYVLKDGKVIDSITVDYMTADIDEEIELVIKGADSALGSYALALEVPAEEVETEVEENPNTGAESVVGVVAALAVVSLASAAAVSLKK